VSTETRVSLRPVKFTDAETVLVSCGGLTASVFRYPTGVKGLRIANEVGHISLLPFQGQQIWDATFDGRPLTMVSIFTVPQPTQDYLSNYGGFLLHCGVLGMGNPGPTDVHPLNGELPNATYDEAFLLVGDDDAGPYMALAGTYRGARAFSHHYIAQPTVTLHAGSSRLRVDMTVRNLSRKNMDFMYLTHINFRPVDGSVLLDTAGKGGESLRVIDDDLDAATLAKVREDPTRHRLVEPGSRYDPELVLGLELLADADGLAHAMQLHPTGTADFVSYRPAQFDHAVRWISRSDDRDALGLLLPATAEPDGYLAEKAKGNVKSLPAYAEVNFSLEFGALDEQDAAALRNTITELVGEMTSHGR
jgi:hypothetical protein